MATIKTKGIIYAAVGVGDLTIEKARRAQGVLDIERLREFRITELRGSIEKVGSSAIDHSTKLYGDLVKRGERTIGSIRNSASTKRAVAQTKTARMQTKAAVTSVRKAAVSSAQATRKAATTV